MRLPRALWIIALFVSLGALADGTHCPEALASLYRGIRTKRLFIARPRLQDLPRLAKIRSHPDVVLMDFGELRHRGAVPNLVRYLVEGFDLWQWITRNGDETQPEDELMYGIYDGRTREPIGNVSVYYEHGVPTLGYELGKQYWGQGLMPEALGALLPVVMRAAGLKLVRALTDHANVRSQAVLRKAGFRENFVLVGPPDQRPKQYFELTVP